MELHKTNDVTTRAVHFDINDGPIYDDGTLRGRQIVGVKITIREDSDKPARVDLFSRRLKKDGSFYDGGSQRMYYWQGKAESETVIEQLRAEGWDVA